MVARRRAAQRRLRVRARHRPERLDLDRIEGFNPATTHAGCYLINDDVDDWHARFVAAGLAVTPIEDMPWGMHEFTLTDPSGNHIRVGRNTSTEVS
jgi:uncharacterized glyoxalase superfamily protein PhnB